MLRLIALAFKLLWVCDKQVKRYLAGGIGGEFALGCSSSAFSAHRDKEE
jgi:hypothetical protein